MFCRGGGGFEEDGGDWGLQRLEAEDLSQSKTNIFFENWVNLLGYPTET